MAMAEVTDEQINAAKAARQEHWKLAKYIEDHVPAGDARSEALGHVGASLDRVYDSIYGLA